MLGRHDIVGEAHPDAGLAEVCQLHDPALADGREGADSQCRRQQAVLRRRARPDRPPLADAGRELPHQRAVAGVVLLLFRRKLLDRRGLPRLFAVAQGQAGEIAVDRPALSLSVE